MAKFEEYAHKYNHVRMERRNGILQLQLQLHTDGGTLRWGEGPHSELGKCFYDIGSDPENKVIIMTGTEDKFIAKFAREEQWEMNPQTWDHILGFYQCE